MAADKDIKLIVRTEVQKALNDLDKTEAGIDDLNHSADKGNTSFKGLGTAVGGFISILAVKQIAEAAFELNKLGAEALNVERAFKKLPGSTKLLKDMRDNVRGTVKDTELMRTALEAIDLGATNNQLRIFTEFARFETVKKGGNTLEKFRNIVSGVLRGSTELLDNFGLSLTEVNKNIEILAREKLNKMASQLTTVERRELGVEAAARIMNARLEATGFIATTNAENIGSMETAWDNLVDEFAKFLQGPLAGKFDWFTNLLNKITSYLKGQREIALLDDLREIQVEIANLSNLEDKASKKLLAQKEKERDNILEILNGKKEEVDGRKDNIDTMRAEIDAHKKLNAAMKTAIRIGNEMFEAWKLIYDTQEEKAKEAIKTRDETLQSLFETNMQGIQKIAETDLQEAIATIDALLIVWENEENKKQQLLNLRKQYIIKINEEERRQAQITASYISRVFEGPMNNLVNDILIGTKKSKAIWSDFIDSLMAEMRRFITSQIVKSFLSALFPGVGSFFSSLFSSGGGGVSSFTGTGLSSGLGNYLTTGNAGISLPTAPMINSPTNTISSEKIIEKTIISSPGRTGGDTINFINPIIDQRYTEQFTIPMLEKAKRRGY